MNFFIKEKKFRPQEIYIFVFFGESTDFKIYVNIGVTVHKRQQYHLLL